MKEKRNQDILNEIWREEVAVSKMQDLKEQFASGLGISFTSVDMRTNGRNATNDFEFIMMVTILERVVNVEKWRTYINEIKSKYGIYSISEFK